MRVKYIELMEEVFCAYSNEQIDSYIQKTKECGLSEHGFPRLTSNLGILIAHGKKPELKNRFIEMMDLCCDEIPTALGRNGHGVGNDFSVKEKDGKPVFYLNLSTGSNDNVKPELVVEALFAHMGLTYNPSAIQIHRIDVYAKADEALYMAKRQGKNQFIFATS